MSQQMMSGLLTTRLWSLGDYRPEILNLAHETPMSGHLGINKTYHKILNHFFRPGLKSDVSQHCKSCHTC